MKFEEGGGDEPLIASALIQRVVRVPGGTGSSKYLFNDFPGFRSRIMYGTSFHRNGSSLGVLRGKGSGSL